jgi:hypothetical protein
LGLATFGDNAEEVVQHLAGALGLPAHDSSDQSGNRWVSWDDPRLVLVFSPVDITQRAIPTEEPRFTNWWYTGAGDDPELVLTTSEGIGIGSSAGDVTSAYGESLWIARQESEEGAIGWYWGTDAGVPDSWDTPPFGFGLCGWFDADPSDPTARVAGMGSGWQVLADHLCGIGIATAGE